VNDILISLSVSKWTQRPLVEKLSASLRNGIDAHHEDAPARIYPYLIKETFLATIWMRLLKMIVHYTL
jgi:hypothetical protein